MRVTVGVEDDPGVRVDEKSVEAVPPDAVEFRIEGTLTVPGNLLGEFEGRRLRPVAVGVTVDGSVVPVELSDGTALDLEAVDVGVEMPDAGDLPTGPADLDRDPERAGVVAFTVTGTISGIDPGTFEAVAAGPEAIESVTFAVEDPRTTDGGGGDDVLAEFGLLGVTIAVRRDGTIVVGAR